MIHFIDSTSGEHILPDKDIDTDQLGTITPYFTVDNADKLIEFVTNVLGGYLIKENRYENGQVQHVRLRIGDSVVMLNESTETYSANVSQIHLYVADTEAIFEAAIQHGAISLMEPNLRPHGDRMAGLKDPCGNIWWIATSGLNRLN